MSTKNEERRDRLGPFLIVVPTLTVVGALGFSVLGGIGAALVAAVVGVGWGLLLGYIATRLNRRESWRVNLANVSVFLAVLASGMLSGGGLLDQMLSSAGLSTPSTSFTIYHPPFGGSLNLFLITFNTLLEWLLIPAALFLNWRIPKRRTLIVIAAVIYYAMRAWTYIYFVPTVFEFEAMSTVAPMSAEDVERFRLWVNLSWIRGVIDISTYILFLLAAFIPAWSNGNSRKLAGEETGMEEVQSV